MAWTLKSADAPTGGTAGGDVATLVYTNGVAAPDEQTRTVCHYRTEGDDDTAWQAMMMREITADLADLNKAAALTSDITANVDPA